jgi:hypothetical protein
MSTIQKRRKELRTELSLIEKQIYDLETTYLEESRDFGSIFVGWDAYLAHDKSKGKKAVQNDERLFSLSSITSPASRKEVKEKEKLAEKNKKDHKKNKGEDNTTMLDKEKTEQESEAEDRINSKKRKVASPVKAGEECV